MASVRTFFSDPNLTLLVLGNLHSVLYMTDGGLGLYTRRLNRLPDGMAVVRETLQRNTSLGLGDADSSAGPGDLLGFLC
ncbi:hypothetical protein E2I00_006702 [Balaenoptera physalus]|uniref:Uncharacterized protein n=1 Tax=Balaenoptera physalus TaxID=9770 RepID=A0A6A1QC83_BALPH|nr:hypothetical protein E2I00_006702 [Balaenoptera physalus]